MKSSNLAIEVSCHGFAPGAGEVTDRRSTNREHCVPAHRQAQRRSRLGRCWRGLHRWVWSGAIRAEDTAVSGLRSKPVAAPLAVKKILACVQGHFDRLTIAAARTRDRRSDLHRSAVPEHAIVAIRRPPTIRTTIVRPRIWIIGRRQILPGLEWQPAQARPIRQVRRAPAASERSRRRNPAPYRRPSRDPPPRGCRPWSRE